jgi:FkbM family methyltransferase
MKKIINPFVLHQLSENPNMAAPTIPAHLSESYAQCAEDIIIESIMKAHCKRFKLPIQQFTYIEIGANHPVNTSSTFLWSQKHGMSGILVEANPNLVEALRTFRSKDIIVNAAVYDEDIEFIDLHLGIENEISSINEQFVSNWENQGVKEKVKVPVIRVNDLLSQIRKELLTVLIIDVESLDLRILKDIDFTKYKPFIIEVEPSDFFIKGNSRAIIEFLITNGYRLVAATDVNLIFQLII